MLKWLRGRKPDNTEARGGDIHVHVGENIFVTNKQTIVLAENREVREQARRLVGVLEKDGINRISTRRNGPEKLTIEPDEVSYFDIPEGEEEALEDSEREMWLRIDSLSLKEGNKMAAHGWQRAVLRDC